MGTSATGVQLLMEQWKQALVALHAAGTALFVAGLAQWVRCV